MAKKITPKLVAGIMEPKKEGAAHIVRGVKHIMLNTKDVEPDGTCLCGFVLKNWLEFGLNDAATDPKVLALEPCQRCQQTVKAMSVNLHRNSY